MLTYNTSLASLFLKDVVKDEVSSSYQTMQITLLDLPKVISVKGANSYHNCAEILLIS